MATVSLQIAANSDDARETSSSVKLNDGWVNMYNNTTWGGLRFLSVTIPQGATIDDATLRIKIPSTAYDDPKGKLYAQAADNPGTFTTATNNITNRPLTTAFVTFDNTSVGTVWYEIDATAQLQEIVNRPGWASGNAFILIIDGNSATNTFRFRSYDAGFDYAQLNINYTAPSTDNPPASRIIQLNPHIQTYPNRS